MNAISNLARAATAVAALVVGFTAPAAAAPMVGGSTVVTLDLTSDPNFVAVLTANGIAPAPVAPGTLGGDPLAFGFPITSVTSTNILHSGGISLTQGDVVLSLLSFDINLTELTVFGTGILGETNLGSLPLFAVGADLSLTLTEAAAGALNSVFMVGESAFTGGLSVGTASFAAVPEPGSLALLGLGLAGLAFSRRRKAA